MATKRRGHGEGSIHKRKDGLWAGTLEVGRDADGKRVRRYVYGRTKAQALGKLTMARDEAAKGLNAADGRTTVAEWLTSWLEGVEGDLSGNSAATYRTAVNRQLIPVLGSMRLAQVGPADVEAMLRGMKARGLSVATQRQALSVLRQSFASAERHGRVHRNAASLARGPRRPKGAKTEDTLTGAEAQAIMKAAQSDRLAALPVVLLTLGLRKGEALALRWEDIDLDSDEPELTVAASLARVAGKGLVRGATKTVGSARTIPLVDPAVGALCEHRAAQERERLAAPVWMDPGIVFASSEGTWIDPRNALRKWHGWTDAAKLGRRRMHASRHYAATALLEAGVPLEVVSAALGHSSLSITADVYARVSADAMRRGMSAPTRT